MLDTMADITIAEFRARFPEFAAQTDDDVAQFVETAYQLSDVSREATYQTAAHLATLYIGEQAAVIDDRGGIIVEETWGPKKLKFLEQAMTKREVFFVRTTYGRLALMLENRSPAGIMSVRNG